MNASKFQKRLEPAQALTKAQAYCAYQERSHQEVRDKLYSYGLYKNQVEDILTDLITSGFLNEERYAKAFAGGKFRMKKWGKRKIENELQMKGLTKRCIQLGLKEIDEIDYRKSLREIIIKKSNTLGKENLYKKRNKVAVYAIGKGFESELVWQMVMDLIED